MTPNPSTLIDPVSTAFPKYAGVLTALANLIADDSGTTTSAPPTTAPVAPPPPVTPPTPVAPSNPAATTVLAGRPMSLSGNGSICAFDFGDPAAPFNALRGYNAAHVYDTPGNYVATTTPPGGVAITTSVTVVADTRPMATLPAGADLAATLAKITSPTILLLPGGATFDLKSPATIAADGITLRAEPGSAAAPIIRRLAAPNVYSTLIVAGSDVSIEGIVFDSDQPLKPSGNTKVGIYAITVEGNNLLVRDCTFRNVDDGLHCQPTARGLTAIDCEFTDELRGCGAYLAAMQDIVLLGCSAVGSVCEHIVRLEGAQNVLVAGSDVNNTDGKETIAIRSGTNVAVTGNTIRSWARISQGTAAVPAIYCKNILFAANHFTGLRPDGPWVQLNPGAQTVLFDGNAFDVDAKQVCVAVQAPVSGLTLTNNQLCLTAGTTTARPLVDGFGNPVFTETGTVTKAGA